MFYDLVHANLERVFCQSAVSSSVVLLWGLEERGGLSGVLWQHTDGVLCLSAQHAKHCVLLNDTIWMHTNESDQKQAKKPTIYRESNTESNYNKILLSMMQRKFQHSKISTFPLIVVLIWVTGELQPTHSSKVAFMSLDNLVILYN